MMNFYLFSRLYLLIYFDGLWFVQLKYTKKKERIVTERKRRIDLERESVGTKAWLSVAKNFEILEVNPY